MLSPGVYIDLLAAQGDKEIVKTLINVPQAEELCLGATVLFSDCIIFFINM